jgi:hypothetical protein
VQWVAAHTFLHRCGQQVAAAVLSCCGRHSGSGHSLVHRVCALERADKRDGRSMTACSPRIRGAVMRETGVAPVMSGKTALGESRPAQRSVVADLHGQEWSPVPERRNRYGAAVSVVCEARLSMERNLRAVCEYVGTDDDAEVAEALSFASAAVGAARTRGAQTIVMSPLVEALYLLRQACFWRQSQRAGCEFHGWTRAGPGVDSASGCPLCTPYCGSTEDEFDMAVAAVGQLGPTDARLNYATLRCGCLFGVDDPPAYS